ncbi:hypothetical protein FQZ97_1040400 [compost metagenome]
MKVHIEESTAIRMAQSCRNGVNTERPLIGYLKDLLDLWMGLEPLEPLEHFQSRQMAHGAMWLRHELQTQNCCEGVSQRVGNHVDGTGRISQGLCRSGGDRPTPCDLLVAGG